MITHNLLGALFFSRVQRERFCWRNVFNNLTPRSEELLPQLIKPAQVTHSTVHDDEESL